MASGSKPKSSLATSKKEEERPRSEPGISSEKLPTKPSTAQSAASEPVDWLGLTRIGSPDSPRPPDPPALKKTEDVREAAKKVQPTQIDDDVEDDDWLKKIKAKRAGQAPKEVSEEVKSTRKVDDWLGGNTANSSKDAKDSGGDFLGLGDEVDLDTLLG